MRNYEQRVAAMDAETITKRIETLQRRIRKLEVENALLGLNTMIHDAFCPLDMTVLKNILRYLQTEEKIREVEQELESLNTMFLV